jgi:hypothetical protein
MKSDAKIHLSKFEKELVQNSEWIFTKQLIIEKVYKLFGELHETYKQISENEKKFLPSFFQLTGGKISKGENYEGLPYVMLDYPSFFSKENIFAVRTMFWWGNFFSITLHISGENYKLKENFSKLLTYINENNFFVCVNENEWQHSFDTANYIDGKNIAEEQIKEIAKKNFFKISKKLELNKWNDATKFLETSFKEIIEFIKLSFPAGEKVL